MIILGYDNTVNTRAKEVSTCMNENKLFRLSQSSAVLLCRTAKLLAVSLLKKRSSAIGIRQCCCHDISLTGNKTSEASQTAQRPAARRPSPARLPLAQITGNSMEKRTKMQEPFSLARGYLPNCFANCTDQSLGSGFVRSVPGRETNKMTKRLEPRRVWPGRRQRFISNHGARTGRVRPIVVGARNHVTLKAFLWRNRTVRSFEH